VFGLAFGGLAIGSPAWVWLRKQLLTATAGVLAGLGRGANPARPAEEK
jgi:hypothetical protein